MSNGYPHFEGPINYPNGAPPFEDVCGEESSTIKNINVSRNLNEGCNFTSISDFKWCMRCGGEVQFLWRGKHYVAVRYGINNKITICEANNQASKIAYDSADDALEFMVGYDRLRDVFTQVTVIDRTI